MAHAKMVVKFAALFIIFLVSLVVSVKFGTVDVPVSTIWGEFLGILGGAMPDDASSMILWRIRVPRTVFAALAGAGLSVCGLVLQTITRNDLADPYVLGVSSGASTGAVLVIIWGWFSFFGSQNVAAGAFIGAAISTVIVMAASGKSTNPIRLVLVGMGVSAFFSALTMMIIYGARHEAQVRSAMFWLLGSLAGMQWSDISFVAAAVILMTFVIWLFRSDLDLLLLGEGEAENLGMNMKRMQVIMILLSSILVAILVSKSGIIGFIGLITPHIARYLVGPSHGKLVIFTAFTGSVLMIWADVASRSLFAPEEIPIGVLTAIVGAPVFLWIVTHRYGEGEG